MTEKVLEYDTKKMEDVEYNFKQIEENISVAAQKAGKSRKDIIFLAATKTVEPVYINRAISCGLKYIGENRVQELLAKYDYYDLENASLHFIGHLQSNKIRQIVGKVDLIQSVDSLKLATEISRQGQLKSTKTDILVEVNIGGEENKSGVEPEKLEELLGEIAELDNISVKGLMTIPPICSEKTEIRKYFSRMNKLFIDIKGKKLDNVDMQILSMGMSSDYEEAILEGANMVRVGSALFGPRIYV
ncbi:MULTISPECIES: YggS family pyridoxal phosphate-dependent enzyme [unclassified Ruminococcus]|uniref:YggS family pyridoxal phosphate-dependent enzyme n=1 Tax=unclassified Ruminococcus TaxID=2608920 RepID=UPI00210863FE|nr:MULTISPECIES: YggS family pyridoxal phosphate-dependent enzyme [unclassified Ruminococcus]MCQ4023139.1 YggS family pyridoxal phosphate-dependent enzyme [Ruminococcus sp. zg-924]MCQ4115090.1 YggS family pyridoxal phosphate-dependent enzyme [Ruminococcus sp. zg-921]